MLPYDYEKIVQFQGKKVQLHDVLIQELFEHIGKIYDELDMVDDEQELTGYDLCDCDRNYGHTCQDVHRV